MEPVTIDELIETRATARAEKNWKLSDEIRDHLDTKHVFIFDTKDGQVVYNEKAKKRVVTFVEDGEELIKEVTYVETTRQDVIDKINNDAKANAMFDAWLYTMSKKRK